MFFDCWSFELPEKENPVRAPVRPSKGLEHKIRYICHKNPERLLGAKLGALNGMLLGYLRGFLLNLSFLLCVSLSVVRGVGCDVMYPFPLKGTRAHTHTPPFSEVLVMFVNEHDEHPPFSICFRG